MQLRFRDHGVDAPPSVRQAIELKLRLALGRHASGIDVAQITLSPASPGHGEGAIRCRIRARLRHGDVISVEDHDADACKAAETAAWWLGKRLGRQRSIEHAHALLRRD